MCCPKNQCSLHLGVPPRQGTWQAQETDVMSTGSPKAEMYMTLTSTSFLYYNRKLRKKKLELIQGLWLKSLCCKPVVYIPCDLCTVTETHLCETCPAVLTTTALQPYLKADIVAATFLCDPKLQTTAAYFSCYISL